MSQKDAHNETSCFHTGLWAERRLNRPLERPDRDLVEIDDVDEDGEVLALPLLASKAAALEPIAPSAETALEEVVWEKLVAVPLTSLSVSSVGSRLMNSFVRIQQRRMGVQMKFEHLSHELV